MYIIGIITILEFHLAQYDYILQGARRITKNQTLSTTQKSFLKELF